MKTKGMNRKSSYKVSSPPLRGIVPNPDMSGLDNSIDRFQCTSFLKSGFSLHLANSDTFHFRNWRFTKQSLILIMFLLLLTSAQAGAATVSWNNLGNGLWDTPNKWSPAKVPDSGDDVVVNFGTGNITTDTNATIKTMTVGGSNMLTVSSTGKLTATSASFLKVFVTSAYGTGNLSGWADAGSATGVAAGDNICQARAAAVGLAGTFKAWLSDSTTDAYCHIQGYTGNKSSNCGGQPTLPVAAGPWVRTNDSHPFADTIDKLVNNNQIYAPVRYNENGTLTTAPYYTGTESSGVYASSNNCDNWTSPDSGSGLQGYPIGTTGYWTEAQGASCNSVAFLLCFQAGSGVPLPAMTAPAGSKKVFVTSTTYNGNLGGLSGADTICQTRASAGGLANSSKFKAWLSSSVTNAIDRFSENSWYRPDGVKVANSKADLTDKTIFTGISQTETGAYINSTYYEVWTATGDNGFGLTDNCLNWLDGTVSAYGFTGLANTADSSWTNYTTRYCDSSRALYCFEDE